MTQVTRDRLNLARDWVQPILAVIWIVTIILVAPVKDNLSSLSEQVERIERVEVPQLRVELTEVQAQVREMRVQHTILMKNIDKMSTDVEYIRRRIEGK